MTLSGKNVTAERVAPSDRPQEGDRLPAHEPFHVLHKYRSVIASVVAIGLLVGIVHTATTTREYQGVATVRADSGSALPERRDLQRRVVRKLNLLNDPEFNHRGGASTLRQQFLSLRELIARPARSFFGTTGPLPPAVDAARSAEVVSAASGSVETPAEAVVVSAFAERMDIVPVQDSQLFLVRFLSGSPQLAADAANAMATEYVSLSPAPNRPGRHVSVVEPARPPAVPHKPNKARNLFVSLTAGFAVGLMLVLGLDYLDDTVKTPEDVTNRLHVPFLGLVPAVRGERRPMLSGTVPHDFGEAYRALRTSLVFTSGAATTRVISVTSAQPLEGKTTTACNLAMVLAFGGSRVLLIDADLRTPGVHETLDVANTVGLMHLLVGQARVREAIQRTSDPNLCVMTAGGTSADPTELLGSARMKQLIASVKQGPFDWVVIDTPPVLTAADSLILTPLVDGVTFVVGAEMTRGAQAEQAIQKLMECGPKVLGAVLNRVNVRRNRGYYSRYYGHVYKNYLGIATGEAAPTKA